MSAKGEVPPAKLLATPLKSHVDLPAVPVKLPASPVELPATLPVEDDEDIGGDTDTEIEDTRSKQPPPTLFRLSSRIKSLKRRGRFLEPKELKPEFDFYADDVVTVRGPDKSFWLCRILEDVLDSDSRINVAWYDAVKDNQYKVSYDDTIYKTTILMHVQLVEDETTQLYSIPKKYIAETNRLLKRSLQNEGTDMELQDADSADHDSDEEMLIENSRRKVFDFPSDENDEDSSEPASKRKKQVRRKSTKTPIKPKKATPSKTPRGTPRTRKTPSAKKVSPPKVVKRGLIPNPDMALLAFDPVFGKQNKIPLMTVKQGIKAVLLKDMKVLEKLLNDKKNIYTLNWSRSPHLQFGPQYYALLNEDRKALKILFDHDKRENVQAKKPEVSLEKANTGSFNFYTFGHAVREVTTSRGNKEGNNAFLNQDDELTEYQQHGDYVNTLLNYALKNNLSYDFIQWYFQKLHKIEDGTIFSQYLHVAIKHGNHKLAGEFMKKAVSTDAYGYNFLHQETLCNTTQKLTKFKSTSVTKKPYSKVIYPLHCACINPNATYAKELFAVVPEYNMADYDHWTPIHYAAVCTGDGPLKFLLSRGVDANFRTGKLQTPLMLASKCGRVHNIKALMESTIEIDDEEGNKKIEKVVKIDAKNEKTMTALHIASKKGQLDCVKALLENGAFVDLQAGAGQENLTALCFAASKGHYNVVKLLLEKGAAPDKKTRRNKTALMYACINGHSQIVAHLLHIGVNPNAVDTSDNTPIHYAAAYGWYHCVQLLLEGGADPNQPNNWKTTPLYLALAKGHVEIGDLLLSADVDVNYPDDQGRTILMTQIHKNDLSNETLNLVKYLVEKKKADVNKKDVNQCSALHLLALTSIYETIDQKHKIYLCERYPQLDKVKADVAIEIADVLLTAGADINSLDQNNETALMLAVRQVNYPLVHVLLKNGANPSIGSTSSNDENILHLLIGAGYIGELKDLSELYPAEYSKELSRCKTSEEVVEIYRQQTQRAFKELLEALLKSGAKLNDLRKNGDTALMMATKNKESFRLLLEYGASPLFGQDKSNENILHKIGRDISIDLLPEIITMAEKFEFPVQLGNMVNNDGCTPLHVLLLRYKDADEKHEQDFVKLVKLYLDKFHCDITMRVDRMKKDGKEVCSLAQALAEGDKHKGYTQYGLFSVLHFVVMKHSTSKECVINVLLKQLGSNHELLNQRDRFGRTPIHSLVHHLSSFKFMGHPLEQLVKYGSHINSLSEDKDKDSYASPLIMILRSCNNRNETLEKVKLFIKLGASVNVCDGVHGSHALSYAVKTVTDNQGLVIVNNLLKAGGDINLCDNYGRTALHYAVNYNSGDYESLIEMENLLVENGARKDILDKHGRLPLHYAFYDIDRPLNSSIADPISVVSMLCDVQSKDISLFGGEQLSFNELIHKYINQADETGKTPLHYASMKGATLSCLHLKKLQADDKVVDIDGNTPLALSLRGDHIGCAMNLLQHNAKANCHIITPIGEKAMEKYEEKLKLHQWSYGRPNPVYPVPKKDSVFQLTIRKNWQGLAYMMLEVANLPLLTAFKAGLVEKKLNLLWTLLKKKKNMDDLKSVDTDGKTLLHLLAYYAKSSNYVHVKDSDYKDSQNVTTDIEMVDNSTEEQYIADKNHIEIAKLLLKSGLLLTSRDDNNALPLHHAAGKNNFEMVQLFLERAPQLINEQDKDGKTPLAHVIMSHDVKDGLTTQQVALIKLLVNKGADINIKYRHDNLDQTLINRLVLLVNDGCFQDDLNDSKKSVGCLDYFFRHDINVDFVNAGKANALITAILSNDEKLVNMILKRKPDLTYADSAKKTCLHHCVKTSEYASHENVDVLQKLLRAGAPVNDVTADGQTALDIANSQKSGDMSEVLLKHKAKTAAGLSEYKYSNNECFNFTTDKDEYCKTFTVDVELDSEKEIKQGIAEQKTDDTRLKPDKALNMESNGELYYDPDTDQPYDVTLTKVDVRWGLYGLNLTYKLQVVYHKGRDLWLLFNRWGRTGGDHQHQQTPYNNPEDATMEFKKIFKSKTGNDWLNLENFQRKPKKYALVRNEHNPEKVLKKQKSLLRKFNLKESAKSNLPEYLRKLMKHISNCDDVSKLSKEYADESYMPFGMISSENIVKAKDILAKIRAIVERPELKHPNNDQDTIDSFEKVGELSNEYYMLVPPSRYSYERIRPLNNITDVITEEGAIQLFTQLNPILKIMLAAQHRRNDVSPLDYCFKALNCRLEMMSPTCHESRIILRNIHATSPGYNYPITGILRYKRDDETYMDTLPEKHLLWHGTKNAHMLGILSQGLQVDPFHSDPTGKRFGTGLYFSWQFSKSTYYTGVHASKCILLCEVSSNGYHYPEKNREYSDESDLWFRTRKIPDPKDTVTMPYGADIFQGDLICDEPNDKELLRVSDNEVIVKNANQAKVRYIVKLKEQ